MGSTATTTKVGKAPPSARIILLDCDEPLTYAEAMVDPNSEKWQEAMKSEIESIRENQV